MRKKVLGDTGLEVSELGFGGIPIQRLSTEGAVAVVRHAYESGITFFDTAAGYSTSEERIGAALENVREGCVIATKSGRPDSQGCRAEVERSLRRLRTDYLDLFQFHSVSSPGKYAKLMAPGGAYRYAMSAKADGIVRHVGFSSHNADVALEMVKSGKFETVQFPFNLIATGAADEIFPEAEKRGMGVIVMKPFGGGAITDAAAAFAFLRQYESYIPIPGIETTAEIDEIIAIYDSENAVTPEIESTWQALRDELGLHFCRRCGYCMPCPQGVAVSGLMTLDTLLKRFPTERLLCEEWIIRNVESIENCVDCGECEEKCPYDLAIREKMRSNVDKYIQWKKEVTRA